MLQPKTKKKSVLIQLDAALVDDLDRLRRVLGITRTSLIAQLILKGIENEKERIDSKGSQATSQA